MVLRIEIFLILFYKVLFRSKDTTVPPGNVKCWFVIENLVSVVLIEDRPEEKTGRVFPGGKVTAPTHHGSFRSLGFNCLREKGRRS